MLSLARVVSVSDGTVQIRHLERGVDGENGGGVAAAAAFGIGGEEVADVKWEAIWELGGEDKWRVVALY